MKNSNNFNVYPQGVHQAQSAVRINIRTTAEGDDPDESNDDGSDTGPAALGPGRHERQMWDTLGLSPARPRAQSTVPNRREIGPDRSQPKSRIPIPIKRIPAKDRWAMVPIEHGEPVDTYDGPRSRTGRPVTPVNRFVGLSSEMAIDGDKTILEPKTVKEALAGKDATKWIKSMESEIDNIESKRTWIETKLPEGRKAVGCKWVFKVKTDADGKVVKYKSRLVAQGFSQIPGIDYEETFAPVGRTTSLRMLLTIAATNNLEVRPADVEGAYLNGKLDVELYMAYPEGMTPKKGCDALRLIGSLYGLKQSGRTWWIELRKGLEGLGFKRTE
jgi:hypothetical protein